MRKENRARYHQRIPAKIEDGKVYKAKTITHQRRQTPSPALIERYTAKWVHWKDTDGARRRGWSNFRRL